MNIYNSIIILRYYHKTRIFYKYKEYYYASSEYWIPLYGILVTTIVGWSIPSIIVWTRSKADVRKLDHCHQRIKKLYDEVELNEIDLHSLNDPKGDIVEAY